MKDETVEEEEADDTTDLSLLAFSKMVEAKFKPDNFIEDLPWDY